MTGKNLWKLAAPPPRKKPQDRAYIIYPDQGVDRVRGLGLRVTANGDRSWVLNYTIGGLQRRFTLGGLADFSLNRARAKAEQIRKSIKQGSDPLPPPRKAASSRVSEAAPGTLQAFAEEWLDHARAHKRPNSIYGDQTNLKAFIYPKLGAKLVAAIAPAEVEKLIDGIGRDRPGRMGTKVLANRVRALLHTIMNEAVKHGVRKDNPCAQMKRFKEHARDPGLEPAQLQRLYDALAGFDHGPKRSHANAVRLMLWTGCRKMEALGAPWKEFKLESGVWKRPPERNKNNQPSETPLSPRVLALLQVMKAEQRPASEDDLAFAGVTGFRWFWRDLMHKAGLGSDPREFHNVHDLRHVYAKALRTHGTPIEDIAQHLGQSTIQMALRYSGKRELAALQRQSAEAVDGALAGNLTAPGE